MLCLILSGFLLFFLSDWNDLRFGHRALRFAFPLGCCLVVLGTVMACVRGGSTYPLPLRILTGAAALSFLGLTLYSLFGALPLEASYARAGEKRSACTVGVYALCRHPGVLWFILLYICLHFTFGASPVLLGAAAALNLLLALFEDIVVFPALLTGYADYKKSTPFLIPVGSSVRRCLHHYRRRSTSPGKDGAE